MAKTLLPIAFLLALALSASAQTGSYEAVPDSSSIRFTIRNMGVKVDGEFERFEAKAEFDPSDLGAASFTARIEVSSINTGIGARDRHLKKEDYFHVGQFPYILFRSQSVSRTAEGYLMTGTLTVKGTSREVELPLRREGRIFKSELSLDRRDYGVGGKSWVLADEVNVELSLVFRPRPSPTSSAKP